MSSTNPDQSPQPSLILRTRTEILQNFEDPMAQLCLSFLALTLSCLPEAPAGGGRGRGGAEEKQNEFKPDYHY
jgi:hypothetical protein